MKHKMGFTLTEILLAVMIVGIIGVALASLTTAASRESGVGRSRTVLRNDFSIALRQLKEDMRNSTTLLYARGEIDTASSTSSPLLLLAQHTRMDGKTPIREGDTVTYIAYCFKAGTTTTLANNVTSVQPSDSKDEGTIERRVFQKSTTSTGFSNDLSNTNQWDSSTYRPVVCSRGTASTWLEHVKFIPPSTVEAEDYPVPFFGVEGNGRASYSLKDPNLNRAGNLGSRLKVNLILELPSYPVVNEVVEEIFSLPNGYVDSRVTG